MERLDRLVAWVLLGFGMLHCGVTFGKYEGFSSEAAWFFAAGLALIYAAAFNLLRVRYAAVAPGIVQVCRVVNLSLLGFVAVNVAGRGVALLRDPGAATLVAAVTLATAFSMFRHPPHGAPKRPVG